MCITIDKIPQRNATQTHATEYRVVIDLIQVGLLQRLYDSTLLIFLSNCKEAERFDGLTFESPYEARNYFKSVNYIF